LIENTPGAEKAIFSTHCHNDLGLAVANTLAAVQDGARQAEVTINGIGERAGNASLEEVLMSLAVRPNSFPVYHSCDTRELTRLSKSVANFTGIAVQANKAIVGANAFAHEAGIHQDGVLKHSQTYEIMTPASVGLEANSLVLGKHSGKAAYRNRLEELGHTDLTNEQVKDTLLLPSLLRDHSLLRREPRNHRSQCCLSAVCVSLGCGLCGHVQGPRG